MIIGIIPARMDSSRFPGKPLADINGFLMVGHCLKRAQMSNKLDHVYVATCDEIIYDYVLSLGGNAVMTSSDHERATDRTAEAVLKIESIINKEIDVVVMLQGDEPMVTPKMIDDSISGLQNSSAAVVNMYSNINTIREFEDENEVKVVLDNNSNALYFSREPIPSRKKGIDNVPMYKQVCVMPFKREALFKFNELSQTPLEIIESVDMMRFLENDIPVKMIYSETESYSVDNKHDLEVVRKKMKYDKLVDLYV